MGDIDVAALDRQRAQINLKKLRAGRGWSQETAAGQLGITRTYLSAMETGYRNISIKMMRRIIAVFGVKYDDFYPSVGEG